MPKRRSIGFPSQPESSAKLRSQDGLTSACDIARSPGRQKLDSTAGTLAEVLLLPFDPIVRIELGVLADQIRGLNKSIAELGEALAEASSKLEGHRSLTSNKGIGATTSAILLSVIGDVNDFSDEKRLATYFGIVPRIANSNETQHSGRIHKRGTKLGRTALVQSALIAAKYSPYLKNFYERVKARCWQGDHRPGQEVSRHHAPLLLRIALAVKRLGRRFECLEQTRAGQLSI